MKKNTLSLQENVLGLICFSKAAKQFVDEISPALFENETHRRIATAALNYFRKYKLPPGRTHLPDLLEDDLNSSDKSRRAAFKQALRDLYQFRKAGYNKKYIRNEVKQFLREQRLKGVILKSAKLLQSGKAQEAQELLRQCAELNLASTATNPAVLIRADQIPDKPETWLWTKRIALGEVTILVGEPGVGKSFMTLDMAARVSSGRAWPDGSPCPRGSVLILSAEDSVGTIRRRLVAMRADLTRIHILTAVRRPHPVTGLPTEKCFDLEHDFAALDATLKRLGDITLVIIDPITAYLGRIDSHKNAEVRGALAPLATMAAQHQAALACVTHFNKTGNGNALSRVIGSMAFGAAPRMVWAVVRDPQNEQRRLFLNTKNNMGKENCDGLSFSIEEKAQGQPRVLWSRAPVTANVNEVLYEMHDVGKKSMEAVNWLVTALANGPRDAKELQTEAARAGIRYRTLHAAKERLGVTAKKKGGVFKGGWEWYPADETGAKG
jgi:hypothetical protein